MNEYALLDSLVNVHCKQFMQDEDTTIDMDAVRDILSQLSDPEVITKLFNFFWAPSYDTALDAIDTLDDFFYEHYLPYSLKIFRDRAFDHGQILFLNKKRA